MHRPPSETPARTRELTALPLFGQALVASRLARRAVLAMLTGSDRDIVLAACDAIDTVARVGDGWRSAASPIYDKAARIRRTRETEAALDAVRWAFDSVGAAEGALDFPVDATVAASAQRGIDALASDPRISPIQLAILVESDIDLIAFACRAANVHAYDALTNHVFERLAPCHALTLSEPRRRAEEEYR